jgi:16S rRNA (cytidine1402-2'-O)-methyltransferase
MLDALVAGFGPDRSAAVCRELTKTYEEVRRGPLSELADWARDGVRGEITVVVDGVSLEQLRAASGLTDASGWVDAVRALEAEDVDRRSAIADVARRAGVPRREVYDAVIRAKSPQP